MNRSLLNQRYVPLRKIAAGGMGEIYLARQTGVAGFQRQVVLKRIHRRLSDNQRAVEMFLGEARLAAALNHPNIVQIHDVGEEDGAYFIVMERVTGASLRELAERATRQGRMVPMELSVTVIAQVLEGLRYAHGYRDESGQPLKIVHRDICPTNILVSLDGAVKIVDFGIARAENQIRQQSGVAPGKFAYMSPEAILGQAVDARSDLFSVGVLLYELTVGQRLFRATSFEGMRRVVNTPIPPPTFSRAGYPVDLEILVMRALERNPADRFESAEEMLEELEQFAFDTGLRLSRLRLGRFVARTLGVAGGAEPADAEEGTLAQPPAPDAPHEDLDFDKGLFDGGRLESQRREAIRQARDAVAELVESATDDDEGETIEIRPASQARLRADTVPAEEPSQPMEGSALIVTDDLVEEVEDIEEEPEILVQPPPALSDRLDAGKAGAGRDREVTKKRRLDDLAKGTVEPTADLRRALADISKDLEAAAMVPGPGASGAPAGAVDDDLERVDRAGRRPLDDLELSDTKTKGSPARSEPEDAPTAVASTRNGSAAGQHGAPAAEPEEDDSSILEPADAPEPERPDLTDDEGLDDRTIEIDGDDSPEVLSVEDMDDGLEEPTLQEGPDEKGPDGGRSGTRG